MQPRRLLSILVACAILCGAASARAQYQGNGLKLGESLLLHLGIGVEVGWDSNVFYESNNPTNSFELRLTPRFDLSNRTREQSRQIEFDFHGALNYLEYLTSDDALRQLRQFGVEAGFQVALFPQSHYNVTLFDNYVRAVQPPYTKLTFNLDRDVNELGARFTLSPGGGRLTFNIGYVFGIDYFEEEQLQAFNLMSHRFDLRASWRFLPKTAVYIAASETLYFYQSPNTEHPNSYPLRVEAGIQGLITAKLTVNAWIGYGNGFYQYTAAQKAAPMPNTPNPNSVVAGVALGWKPTPLSAGTLGYTHDFVNSLLGSYYDMDQVYLSWTQLLWRFTGFLRFSYANERFYGITEISAAPMGQTSRTDNFVTLNTRVDYPFKSWLWASVGYDLQLNRSNGQLAIGAGNPPGLVPVDYTKHVVYLRLTVWY